MHKVSIIMGIYNCSLYLDEAIQSIMDQTFSNWELILCDDGSTDDTYKVAKRFADQDKRIVLLRNEKNLGLNITLNKCLSFATGDFIARMDGDDISLPDRLEKEMLFLDEHPEYDVVSCPMIYFDENGEYRRGKGGKEPTAETFPKGTPICHAPCMVRKEAFQAVGGYSETSDRIRVEDWDLWLRMYAKGFRLYSIDECLYMMRDGRDAFHRRKYKFRINEAKVSASAVKMLNLPVKYYVYAAKPLVVGLLPKMIYMYLHRRQV